MRWMNFPKDAPPALPCNSAFAQNWARIGSLINSVREIPREKLPVEPKEQRPSKLSGTRTVLKRQLWKAVVTAPKVKIVLFPEHGEALRSGYPG